MVWRLTPQIYKFLGRIFDRISTEDKRQLSTILFINSDTDCLISPFVYLFANVCCPVLNDVLPAFHFYFLSHLMFVITNNLKQKLEIDLHSLYQLYSDDTWHAFGFCQIVIRFSWKLSSQFFSSWFYLILILSTFHRNIFLHDSTWKTLPYLFLVQAFTFSQLQELDVSEHLSSGPFLEHNISTF